MYSPSANNIGMDLNVPTVRMVNRDAATLVVGDVVVMSTAHTGVVYPPTTRTQEPFSPLASIVKAGSAPFTPGFIGTVARLGPLDGRTNDTVDVVFGGLANAKVAAVTTDVAIGTQLSLSATTGQLTNDATGRIVAISLGAVTAGQTANIDVILDGEIAADTATLGTFATLAVTGLGTLGTLSVTGTTASTSTTTGAAVIAGGVGIGGALNAGADSFVNGVRVGRGTANSTANTVLGAGALTGTGATSVTAVGNLAAGSLGSAVSQSNVFVGSVAYELATAAGFTTAVGHAAGRHISGSPASDANTFIGASAGRWRGVGNTDTVTVCNNSIFIGTNSGPLGDSETNQIAIGANARGNGSNTTTIGNSSTTGTFIPAGNLTLTNGNFTAASSTSAATISCQAAGGASLNLECGSVFNQIQSYNNNSPLYITAGVADMYLRTATNQVRMTVGNDGNISIANGNLIIGTSGKGIDFSAHSNAAGMTSELLSDYEEGTWTPTYVMTGTNFAALTMDVVSATYTKIGRQVTVRGFIRTDNVDVTGATGSVWIGGLPFALPAGDAARTAGCIGTALNWTNAPDRVMTISGTSIVMYRGTAINISAADMVAGATADQNRLEFAITYFT